MEFLIINLTDITSTGWTAIVITISMLIIAGIMFLLGKEKSHFIWGVFCVAIAVWSGAFYAVTLADNPETARFWWKISFTGLILNPFMFFHFVLEFINNGRVNKIKPFIVFLLYIIAGVFLYLNLATNLIINEVTFLFDEIYYNTSPGKLQQYFMIIFVSLVLLAHYLVYREYRKRVGDTLFRQRVGYFFIATLIAYFGGTMNFLPVYKIQVPPVTNGAVAIGSGIIAYAILRYRLFNARVVAAQLLTLVLVGFTVFRLVVSTSSEEIIFNILLLIITLFVGIYLILSVRKEVEQRDKLAELNKKLEAAYLEVDRLSKAKSGFIRIVSHQLKTPATAIKGYVSMMLDGSYGQLRNQKIREKLGKIYEVNENLKNFINDLLDVSRIEAGKIEMHFEKADLEEIISGVVGEMKFKAEDRKLSLKFEKPEVKLPQVLVDKDKIRQVISNLIDNAIKYTDRGGVTIAVNNKFQDTNSKQIQNSKSQISNSVLITVKDTGIGIERDELNSLFKDFLRGRGVAERTEGAGLGLHIAKRFVEMQNGKIWAESEGRGRGSTFYIELPMG